MVIEFKLFNLGAWCNRTARKTLTLLVQVRVLVPLPSKKALRVEIVYQSFLTGRLPLAGNPLKSAGQTCRTSLWRKHTSEVYGQPQQKPYIMGSQLSWQSSVMLRLGVERKTETAITLLGFRDPLVGGSSPPLPIFFISAPVAQSGRGSGLKIRPVWVRIPWGVP